MSVISGVKARLNGLLAEKLAQKHLVKQGLTFIQANYHCRWGEIDLIFKDQEQWVFVEVKSKQNNDFGNAEEAYNHSKRVKLHKAIYSWLNKHNLNPEMTSFRIDLLAINGKQVNWLKNVE